MKITLFLAFTEVIVAYAMVTSLEKIVVEPTENLNGTVIFIHGSYSYAEEFKALVDNAYGEEFTFPNLKIIYPSAPKQPYSILDGNVTTVWFDRLEVSRQSKEQLQGIDDSALLLNKIFEEESKLGIKASDIVIGGYSMGGSMSFHMAYRYQPTVKAVFTVSSFLNDDSKVYKTVELNEDSTLLPPLQMHHGTADEVVSLETGNVTFTRLQKSIPESIFYVYPNLGHTVSRKVLERIREFVLSKY